MSKKLKVWSCCADGRNDLIVATTSMKEAAKLMKLSLYFFREYASETGNKTQIEIAMSSPGTVFTANLMNTFKYQYTKLIE